MPSEAFIRDRILAIRRANQTRSDLFAAVEVKADRRLEQAHRRRGRDSRTTVDYLEILRVFPFTRAAGKTYEELATLYVDLENFETAARYLLEYARDFPHEAGAVRAGLRGASRTA